ncbi:CBS domain-containing protein [Marinibaculum pumilum]|uniref:CBS domain-containing protein n=1 Tax=Marinibaculum pumilum TaxID=1766165 RepID=A0ABV7L9S0_9PROT
MQIKEIMTSNVEISSPGTTLAEAAREMKARDIGFLPVGYKDRLVGMVTDRDIVVRGLANGHDPQIATLQDIMTGQVLYLYDDQTIEEAAESFARNAVRRMAVVDRDKRLAGIVTLGDLAAHGMRAEAGDALEVISGAA